MIHLLNAAFKLFCNLIHDDILLILIICNYKKNFQLIISDMFKCFQNFSKFLKSFNVDFIVSAQFCIINIVVAL